MPSARCSPRTARSPRCGPAISIAQALSGFMAVTGSEAGDPVKAGPPIADAVCSLLAAYGALAALWARDLDRAGAERVHGGHRIGGRRPGEGGAADRGCRLLAARRVRRARRAVGPRTRSRRR